MTNQRKRQNGQQSDMERSESHYDTGLNSGRSKQASRSQSNVTGSRDDQRKPMGSQQRTDYSSGQGRSSDYAPSDYEDEELDYED